MARHVWTEADIAAIRRGINLEKTYAEIGAGLGVSASAVSQKVARLGWSSQARSDFLRGRRCKGKKRPKDVAQKIVRAIRQRMKDPEQRAKHAANCRALARDPRRLDASRRAMDAKRGGPLTPDVAETTHFLRVSKRIPAREAYAIATQSTTASKGA